MMYSTIRFGDLYAIDSRNGLSKPSKIRGSGYKMINMGELFANDRIYDIPMELVPLKDPEKINAKVEVGDLLFARQSLVLEGAVKCSIVMEVSPLTVFESHLIRVRLEEVLTNAELSNQDYMSALSEEIKGKLGDDNFEKSFELELSEGKNFISFIQKAFDWSENRIDQIEDESHKEQAKQEFLIEKKIWTDFERHLSYNYDLDEITVATYMQEFAMISKESEPAKDAVQFLTIHASKGKEFDHVILIGMVNDELPSFQSMKKGIDSVEMEEERRNCFVAITRTQKKLYLTYSAKYYGWRKNPSLFLNEMFF